MLTQHIKTNHAPLKLFILLACNSFTLHGMELLKIVQEASSNYIATWDSLFYGNVQSQTTQRGTSAQYATLSFKGLICSRMIIPLALITAGSVIYTNPLFISTLLNMNFETVARITPMAIAQAINRLSLFNKNCAVVALEKCLSSFQGCTIWKQNISEVSVNFTRANPFTWFTNPDDHPSIIKYTNHFITLCSFLYVLYSAWSDNCENRWKNIATTIALQVGIRGALHFVAIPNRTSDSAIIKHVQDNNSYKPL